MTKRLIVNADDYGHSPGTCLGIREAHLQGIVSSTTAMMNRPLASAELTVLAQACPMLGAGVHLVLTAGKPVLPPESVPTLVDTKGDFLRLPVLAEQLDRISLDQVRAEWNAQAEKFIRHFGKNPDHLDSHHHCSYFTPGLFELMIRLASELTCAIRKPYAHDAVDAALYLPVELVETAMRIVLMPAGTPLPPTTERFFGDFFDAGATLEHLLAILEAIAADPIHETFELMCHPAKPDHLLAEVSDYIDKRSSELAILQDPAVRKRLEDLNIQLIRFSDL